MSLFYEDDIEALRHELRSVRERQELLYNALTAANDELEILSTENKRLEQELAECKKDYQ